MGRAAKYQRVSDWVHNRIANGELRDGDRLESEHEISALFKLSRQTVRHALSNLEQEGVLVRVQGSGTYVRVPDEFGSGYAPLFRTVTIISTYVDGYIFPKILQEMVRTLEKAGYSSRIMFTNNHVETERRLLERLLTDESRDPLIVEPVMSGLPSPNLNYYRRLLASGIPILFFHSFYPELPIPHISLNDERVGRIAAEYLLAQGHTKIGGIFKADDGQGKRRYAGFMEAMRAAGVPVREEAITWVDTQEMRDALLWSPRVLKRLEHCTACVCYNDEMAHLVTELCLKQGIRIPEDLSLISVDNSELAQLNAVPLTSVAHPMEILGQKTAESMIHMIRDPEFDATYEFETEIEERASVAPYREESGTPL